MKKKILTLVLGIIGITIALDIMKVLVYHFLGTSININATIPSASAIWGYFIFKEDEVLTK